MRSWVQYGFMKLFLRLVAPTPITLRLCVCDGDKHDHSSSQLTTARTHTCSHKSWVLSVARANAVNSLRYDMEKEVGRQVRSSGPEEYTVASTAVTNFLLGAPSPVIATRHPEEDGVEYGIFGRTNTVQTTAFSKKGSSCKSSSLLLASTSLASPCKEISWTQQTGAPKDGRKLRGRSLAHRGNCELLTVWHARASECFFEQNGEHGM